MRILIADDDRMSTMMLGPDARELGVRGRRGARRRRGLGAHHRRRAAGAGGHRLG